MNQRLKLALSILMVTASCITAAAEFTVTPVRIFMSPRDRAVAVTISNDSNEEIVMQADLYLWAQKPDGSDELTLTEDLILSPPILKVPPQSRQVVRLARLGPPPQAEEQTYRMIVREVPEARPRGPEQVGVQVALAFSLPIFITPPTAKRDVGCEASRTAKDTVNVACLNKGRAYAQVRGMELWSGAGAKLATRETGGYILPQIKRTFDLKANEQIGAGPVKVQVAFDDGTSQAFEAVLPD